MNGDVSDSTGTEASSGGDTEGHTGSGSGAPQWCSRKGGWSIQSIDKTIQTELNELVSARIQVLNLQMQAP